MNTDCSAFLKDPDTQIEKHRFIDFSLNDEDGDQEVLAFEDEDVNLLETQDAFTKLYGYWEIVLKVE